MNIWETCLITGKHFTTVRGFCNHLRGLKLSSKEYFDRYHKHDGDGQCKMCGRETKYHGFSYANYCSDVCACKSPEHRNAVSNRFVCDDRDTKLDAFRLRRGKVSSNPTKAHETFKAKAAAKGISVNEYRSEIASRAAKSVTPDAKRQQTIKAAITRIERGYNEDAIVRGNSYKDVIVDGRSIRCQGYEPPVIKFLVEEYQDKFSFGKSGNYVDYFCSISKKNRMYFPDATSDTTLVEVKSKYTYQVNKQNTIDKLKFSYLSGKKIILVIPNRSSKCELSDGFQKLLDWAISSQASNHGIYILEEGSTTILYGVGSSDPKCLKSFEDKKDCDIVWSAMKVAAVMDTTP